VGMTCRAINKAVVAPLGGTDIVPPRCHAENARGNG
jgi:hypothetical protein